METFCGQLFCKYVFMADPFPSCLYNMISQMLLRILICNEFFTVSYMTIFILCILYIMYLHDYTWFLVAKSKTNVWYAISNGFIKSILSCNNLRVNESWVPNYRNWIHHFHHGNHFLHHISTLHQYTLHYHKYIHCLNHILESMSNVFRNRKYYYT